MRVRTIASLACAVAVLSTAQFAQAELLFSDNFNAPDTTNFDGAPLTGRLSGSLVGDVVARSARTQQHIAGGQLRMIDANTGRLRFEPVTLGTSYDWAGGAGGAAILNNSMRVEFDWTATGSPPGDWISFNIGHRNHDEGEPGFRVNHGETDYGILFRNNGGTQRFDNGAGTTTGSFSATTDPVHVVIDLDFVSDSFADGSLVDAVASVDGVVVDTYTFDLNNNGGELFMELGTLETGMLIDNFSVTATPEPTSIAIWSLIGLGLAGFGYRRLRRQS